MEKSAVQTVLDEKINELSPEKRKLLELLFGGENFNSEPEKEISNEFLSEAETKLKTIWEEVLNIKELSPKDNFFALGGDSLHCIQIVAKARKADLDFSTADLFEAQTIEKLAQKIGANKEQNDEQKMSENDSPFSESGLADEDLAKLLRKV